MTNLKPLKTAVPKHIGIILDGNRRFAQRLMLKPWQGHEWGAKKVEKILEWCREVGIREVTFYAFSIENFHSRPKQEFDFLMELFEKEYTRLKDDERLEHYGIRINFIGRIWMFPEKLQKVMRELMEKTKAHDKYVVNFAMAYGGRAEVIDAVKRVADMVKKGKLNVEQINEETFSENLYMQSEPDLIIRTSESRLSGFLPWQSTYAEIIFLPEVLWPEFTKEHLEECIEEYKKRKRRFGG